jgi:hypothetical protein
MSINAANSAAVDAAFRATKPSTISPAYFTTLENSN